MATLEARTMSELTHVGHGMEYGVRWPLFRDTEGLLWTWDDEPGTLAQWLGTVEVDR